MDSLSRPRRSRAFWVAIALGVLLSASFLANIVGLGFIVTTRQWETQAFVEEHVAGERAASDKVLDVRLTGTIHNADVGTGMGRSQNVVADVTAQLRQASRDHHVKALLLEINSPGGGITASDVLYHELEGFRAVHKMPVVVLCDDLTASGGYYVSMASDHIMAHETSLVGSIGVIAELTDVQGLMRKVGVQMNVIKSRRPDGSESYKDIGSPFRAMKPAERAMMQTIVQTMWTRFVDVVEIGRKGRLTRPQIEDLADGRIWTGRQALALHLVDSMGYRDDAFKKAAELAHAPNVKLVAYRRPAGFISELLSGAPQTPNVQTLLDQALDGSPRLKYTWTAR